jgi:hypothetical protein
MQNRLRAQQSDLVMNTHILGLGAQEIALMTYGPSKLMYGIDRMPQILSESVQLSYDQCVAFAERLDTAAESRPVITLPRSMVLTNVSGDAIHSFFSLL